MDHLLEVLKIVDGGLSSDRRKVLAFAEQLAGKLETDGDKKSAASIRKTILNRAPEAKSSAHLSRAALPVDGESRLALADERTFSGPEVQIFLEQETAEQVEEFVRHFAAADQLLARGVGLASSLLIYGPPGCGKTELAKYIAGRLELPLLTSRSDSLVSSFLGSTAKNLRLLFEHAMSRPCVLFLDEFDALAKLRDDQHELGELKRVVVSLLQNIDALDPQTLLIAATNHEHLLDPAVWRRFSFRLRMDLPSVKVRSEMLRAFLGTDGPPIDFSIVADALEGLSGAELRQMCEEARRAAVVAGADVVPIPELLRRVFRYRVARAGALPVEEQISEARKLSPRLFTVRRLSEAFGVSTGKISAILKEGGANVGD